jgi:S-adenosylmethionine decarboxylase
VFPSGSPHGSEWIVEAYGCDPVCLGAVASLRDVFDRIVDEVGLNPVGDSVWHQFPSPGGVTGMQMLAESHLTVHTFPEHASACFNLFCCTPREAWAWDARLALLLGASDVRVRVVSRAYVSPVASAVAAAPAIAAASARAPGRTS